MVLLRVQEEEICRTEMCKLRLVVGGFALALPSLGAAFHTALLVPQSSQLNVCPPEAV